MNVPTREILLNHAFEQLKQGFVWYKYRNTNGFEYFRSAETLIEVLEVFDCGSIGGVDVGQPPTSGTIASLGHRLDWLANKHKSYESEELKFSQEELLRMTKHMMDRMEL